MATYDGLGSFAQVGADLNQWSSDGWAAFTGDRVSANPGFSTWIDGNDWHSAFGGSPYGMAWNIVDVCIHDGKPHVIWVEPQGYATGHKWCRGPYVARLDGTSWTLLGGELEANDLLPNTDIFNSIDGNVDARFYWGDTVRFYPSRPRIVSDGTDVYAVYTEHVIDGLAAAVEQAQLGAGYDDRLQPHAWNYARLANQGDRWASRRVICRRWNGTDWELWGEAPAITNNWRQTGSDNQGSFSGQLSVSADPSEPGIVYVGFGEVGPQSVAWLWNYPPHFFVGFVFGPEFFGTYTTRVACARFDGTGTPEIKELFSDSVPGITAQGSIDPTGISRVAVGVTNKGGTPWLFWATADPGGGPGSLFLSTFDQGFAATTQEIPNGPIPGPNWPGSATQKLNWTTGSMFAPACAIDAPTWSLVHDPDRGVFYVRVGDHDLFTVEVGDDGASPFQPVDGAPDCTAPTYPGFGPDSFIADSDGDNIWGFSQPGWDVIQFHRNCGPATVDWGQVDPALANTGQPAMARDGNSLYVAAALHDPVNRSADLKIRVYRAAIQRNRFSCGTPVILDLRLEGSVTPASPGS